jgi:hypothetical protein
MVIEVWKANNAGTFLYFFYLFEFKALQLKKAIKGHNAVTLAHLKITDLSYGLFAMFKLLR